MIFGAGHGKADAMTPAANGVEARGGGLRMDPFRRLIRIGILASLAINLLALITPLYFTQVYDRVLTSHSVPTLVAITAVTMVAITLLSLFDLMRTLLCARASTTFYAQVEARVFAAARRAALTGGTGRRSRAFDDLEAVRGFLSGPVPAAMLDVLFAPLFIIVLFAIHPALGTASLVIVGGLIILALMSRSLLARTSDAATEGMRRSGDLSEAHLRSLEPAIAMGYATRMEARAADQSRSAILGQMRAVSATGGVTTLAKSLRSASQILIIAIAAWLALEGLISTGAIIAASILFSRSLAPIDQLIGSWRMIFQVRGSWDRLKVLFAGEVVAPERMRLPPITGAVSVEGLVVAAPGGNQAILQGIAFELAAGESVGVVGPSGSGKSTLARALVGAWPVARGSVRLDGADIAQRDMDEVGAQIGYLPQTVELLPGTIAENIGRFGPDDPDGVIAAARAAGLHELILAMPNGYDTRIGEPGFALSGGQRQRVGLARALYGDPALVVLDEPDASLDRNGEIALAQAMQSVTARGATLIVIAHKTNIVAGLQKVIVMTDGKVKRIGTVGELLPQIQPVARQGGTA